MKKFITTITALAVISCATTKTDDTEISKNNKMGSLEKSVIDEYIRENLPKIQKCYEKELYEREVNNISKDKLKDFEGKVIVRFVISKTGAVALSELGSSTMNAPALELCIIEQIKKIKFPEPRGGGIVIVNYPFIFKNSEQ